jgi:SAM-dependent methyltransferase
MVFPVSSTIRRAGLTSSPGLACRSCGGAGLDPILSLGSTPLANSLLTEQQLSETQETFPLAIAFCAACSLVQLTETIAPEKLFRNYLYFSSFSDAMLRHVEQIARRLTASQKLGADSLVAEVASNDGYLLQYYKQAGVPVLGIEPARNIAKVAEERGIPTISEFFGDELAEQLASDGKRADIIHANNVLAHVPDLNGFVRGFSKLLKEDGMAVVEFPYLKDLIDHCEFDTIYHEHIFYFSLHALDSLFRRNGLVIHDVERLPIHGGSLRLFAGHEGRRSAGPRVTALLQEEEAAGMNQAAFYKDFASRVEGLKISLRSLLTDLKSQGKRVAAYGAAAKASTLLNYFGIGREFLDYVVDRSTYKQGLYMPGVHVPIFAPEKLIEDKPDYVLLLPWNFAEEILAQQAAYRAGGGRFIQPIPEVTIL